MRFGINFFPSFRPEDKLTLPRAMVIGNMKRDVLTIRAAFQQSGSGLVI